MTLGPTEAEKAIAQCRSDGGDTLTLSHLTTLPKSLRQVTQLRTLTLQSSQIKELPDWLVEFQSLATLQLMWSGIRTIPNWLSQFPNLSTINLAGPEITLSLEPLTALSKLDFLILQNAHLAVFPAALCRMKRLRHLMIQRSGLLELPQEIGSMRSLQILDLSGNKLTSLPETLRELPKLHAVILADNAFKRVPEVLHDIASLENLNLKGNRNLGIPREILAQDRPSDILAYARRLTAASGKRPLNEAKVILVGRGGVGKTTLVHQLVHDKFVVKTKTRGIKVSDWQIPNTQGPVTAHVWDFGGQEIMHGTHQLFLTERSLYILVLAGREDREDEDAEYWLKMIRAFGGDSPVIVVLNKIKEHRFDLNEEGLREKYPNIRAFVETDCKINRGIRKLRRTVTQEIDRMDSIRAAFPAGWFEIKERLSDMPENFMPFERFREICHEHGEARGTAQDELARFLHILGIALNYRDDSRLRETSVLNPKWVTTGIYKLLNDDTIRRRRGLLRSSDLTRVLPEADYPVSVHRFLLDLMKKFELCFPLDDESREHLIPELLGKKQPLLGDEFDVEKCFCFEYRYGTLLPEGLLPRFIVRAYTRIEGDLRWRSGVVLGWKKARALVKADDADRQVLIRVHGKLDARRELLSLVRQHFDAIHRNFRKLDPVEMIRLPGNPEVVLNYAKVEAFATHRFGQFSEYWKGAVWRLDAAELLTQFELPGASHDPAGRGAALADQLPLGLSAISKQHVQ